MSEQAPPLTPMAPGGKWMQSPGKDSVVVYVVMPEHQNRLLTRTQEEGGPWSIVPDPRDPSAVRIQSAEADLANELNTLRAKLAQKEREEAMRAEIENLKAKIAVDFEGAAPPMPEKVKEKETAKAR